MENIFSWLSSVVPSHPMDRELFGFADIKVDGVANPNGDIAFYEEPCSTPASVPGTIPLQPL
jgi:tRNA 2-thiocytidine biosynthesis protein TtcA